jgi:hypothetical protein
MALALELALTRRVIALRLPPKAAQTRGEDGHGNAECDFER